MMLLLLLLLDLGFGESSQQAIGESGGEDSEDEWNYVKVDKKLSDGLAVVEEASEPTAESPVIQHREEEIEQFEDKQSDFDQVSQLTLTGIIKETIF